MTHHNAAGYSICKICSNQFQFHSFKSKETICNSCKRSNLTSQSPSQKTKQIQRERESRRREIIERKKKKDILDKTLIGVKKRNPKKNKPMDDKTRDRLETFYHRLYPNQVKRRRR